jgi:hypothetical protein
MEISTEENEAIVRGICDAVTAARESGQPISPEQQLVYDIDYLLMEVNSGASFEQYFRWASVGEIMRVVPALRKAGLEEKSDLTEWSATQDEQLRELFPALEDQNGRVTNTLAMFARKDDAAPS